MVLLAGLAVEAVIGVGAMVGLGLGLF